MLIDAHIHVGSWNYNYYSPLSVKVTELNKLLARWGIDGAIIFPTDIKNNAQLLNQIKKYGKKKYWFFPWCDPKNKDIIKFLDQNLKYINGLKIHSSLDMIKGGITNKLYKPFLNFAGQVGIPVFVHCGRWQEYVSYKFVLEMASIYKDIKFIMGHMGGDFEGLKIQAPKDLRSSGLNNVWMDISATREYWTIKLGLKEVGCKKFIFGSDFPVMHPKMSIISINELSLTPVQKERIFSKNILEVLGNKNLPITGG